MRLRIRIFCILLATSSVLADSFRHNNTNNHGVVGLINMPTARFFEESSIAFTTYRGDPDRKITLTLMPYDWLEASTFYTRIKGKPYGNGFSQDYVDKGFNLKLRLKEEGVLPALAIGFNDIAGTGFYSSEYLVSSYGIGKLDTHLGLGWGRMASGSLGFKNILIDIDSSFTNRNSNLGEGGNFNYKDFFSGKDISLFGGVSYLLSKNLMFKLEYDSSEIPEYLGFPKRTSNYSFGLEFINNKNFSSSVHFERGDYFGIKLLWKDNSSSYVHKKYKNKKYNSEDYFEKLRYLLSNNDISVKKINQTDVKTYIELSEYAYKDFRNLESNVKNSLIDSGLGVEEVIISYTTGGLNAKTSTYKINGDVPNSKEIYLRKINPGFTISPNLVVRPFLASREDFIKLSFLAELNAQYIFNDKLFWTVNLKHSLWQNFDDLYLAPVDTYPNQVRSDIKEYLKNFNNGIVIGRSQLDFFHTFSNHNHFQFSAGIFEEMFNGFGFEYLWNDPDSFFAVGFEVFKIYKRDYGLGFGQFDYSNVTGHLNFYYENSHIIPFSIHASYGEYLAGDRGYTLDFSRRFKNGVSMGAFFTKTDVTYEQFGEGSFDKGIYFEIPLSGEWFSYLWKPLTKDPGAKLNRKDTIYNLLRKYKL